MTQIQDILFACGDKLSIFSGDDELTYAIMAIGGKGVISVAGNIIPNDMNLLVESMLKNDFKQVRVRHYNDLCRIEVLKYDIPRLLSLSNQVISRLKKLGYNYITVDLEGYRSGSMNPVRKDKQNF